MPTEEVLAAIDRIITDCAKRDLVPSAEVVDQLLDLRNHVDLADREAELAPTV